MNPENPVKKEAKAKKEKTFKTYNVDFSSPVENKLLSLEACKKYLETNIKVNGIKLKQKASDSVKVSQSQKDNRSKNSISVTVDTNLKFSKRYIRYLVKKFLKREGVVRYLVVQSSGRNGYAVKVLRKNEA
ncbi:MAG: 60S ribosomal protein L22 [archaeon]|nr:60S ribosomal protein L22 [archaeon]